MSNGERELDVAKSAIPCTARFALLRSERHGNLVLRARADTVLVDDLIRHALRAGRGDSGGPDGLVLGKGFLSEEGTREVQVAARPGGIVAEGPEIFDGALDLILRECVAEGGHATIERAHRTAAMRHGHPVTQWLDGVGRAVGEIGKGVTVGKREIKTDNCRWRALAIHAMTRRTRGGKDLLTGCVCGERPLTR